MEFQVFRSLEEWSGGARNAGTSRATVAAIGNFDGVHIGHQKILQRVAERARAINSFPAVVTFDPHPLAVLRPAEAPALITTLLQRLEEFARLGLAGSLVLPFDLPLSQLSPEQFVDRILVQALRVSAVLVGSNFRFGHRQSGDAESLRQLGERHGFAVEIVPAVVLDGQVVSSSAIRKAVSEGDMESARRMLGRPFTLSGEIRTGTGQGRKLLVPTLNLACESQLLPKKGVYATETLVAGKLYRSATNVGLRPTFDGQNLTVESHLFDFSDTLTSSRMEVRFWARLRDEKKFANPAELREQIERDLERAREFFTQLPAK